jgi:putative transposase
MQDTIGKYQRKSYMEIGELFFWTATINKWYHLLKEDKFKQVILDSLLNLSERELVEVFAFVIMPNHVHFIWRTLALNGKETVQGSFLKYTAHARLVVRGDTNHREIGLSGYT